MRPIERSMAHYYAARASEYDRVYRKPERQADLRKMQECLPPIFAGARVVDVACGTGYWTQYLAPRAERIVGVDASPETLAVAQPRLASAANVMLVAGDAYRLPLHGESFDAAFVGFWLSHVPLARRHEFLTGLHRVLEPEAKVVLIDNLYVEGSNHRVTERDRDGNTYQQRQLDNGSVHRVLKNFPAEAELRDLAASAGARRIEYAAWDYFWLLRYAAPAVSAKAAG